MNTPLIEEIEAAVKAGDEGRLNRPLVRRLMVLAAARLKYLEGLPKSPRKPIDRLLYNISYSETTPESAECGDLSDNGSLFKGYHCESFEDVVNMIKSYGAEGWSSSPHIKGTFDWLTSGWQTEDYTTMTERETSIHPNNKRALRYLEKAWRTL